MPVSESGKGATIGKRIDNTVEDTILEIGFHVCPRQAADDEVDFLSRLRDMTGQVFRRIVDDLQAGETPPELAGGVGVELDDEEFGLIAQAIQNDAGEGAGARAEFDDEAGAAEIAARESSAGEGGRAGPERADGGRVTDECGDELQSFVEE